MRGYFCSVLLSLGEAGLSSLEGSFLGSEVASSLWAGWLESLCQTDFRKPSFLWDSTESGLEASELDRGS